MPEFILDTSGHIRNEAVSIRSGIAAAYHQWRDLDSFTQGYIEALFFTETEPGTTRETWDPEVHAALPGDVAFADLAPQALATIIADCARWQAASYALIEACAEFSENLRPDNDDVWTRAGRDYWFTRNGHGVGFWEDDRWPAPQGHALDAASKAAGSMDVYLGDDGKVHVT